MYIMIIKKPHQINIKLTPTNDLTQPLKMTSKMVESAWANIGFFLYQLDPKVKRLVRRLEYLPFKIFKKKQSLVFNQTCLYIYIYTHIHSSPGG